MPFVFGKENGGDVKIKEQWKHALALLGAGRGEAGRREETAQRKTVALPSVLSPYSFPSRALPKPTPANLRRFAETPVVRRAINLIKDRVASMDWQVRLKRDHDPEKVAFAAKRAKVLRQSPGIPQRLPTPCAPCSSRSSRTRSSAASAPSRWS